MQVRFGPPVCGRRRMALHNPPAVPKGTQRPVAPIAWPETGAGLSQTRSSAEMWRSVAALSVSRLPPLVLLSSDKTSINVKALRLPANTCARTPPPRHANLGPDNFTSDISSGSHWMFVLLSFFLNLICFLLLGLFAFSFFFFFSSKHQNTQS